jgi:predicted nucleic acid-binding protein
MTNSVVCVDASLSLKLIFPEPDSHLAREQWEQWQEAGTRIIAPTLWAYEVTSVIRNRTFRGLLDPEMEADIIFAVHALPVELMAPVGLHQYAWKLAHRFNRPAAYDAHYLALTDMAGAHFWTADERLYNAVRDDLPWIHHLQGET